MRALTLSLLAACGSVHTGLPTEHTDAGSSTDALLLDGGATTDAPIAATCNGYEPCGVHPVVVPPGYALENFISYDDYASIYGTCTAFEDCGMWNGHYTMQWIDGNTNQPVAQYYNRMSSPFPWLGSRYEIDVAPKKIQYVTFHVMAPGETYKFHDGTLETRTDRMTGAVTCFERGPGRMQRALLGNLGGTGNGGIVKWNISVLPGDMGNSGNASTCAGTNGTTNIAITSDPAVAAATPSYCLLREGQTYYMNMMSSGAELHFDCSTQTCTMGGFQLTNFVGSDGTEAPEIDVACP